MGKLVIVTAAAKRVLRKLGYLVNESILEKLCLEEGHVKGLREEDDLTVIEMSLKNKGRPLLLGKILDDHMQENILKMGYRSSHCYS